jgi:hypothetical protein
MAIKSMKSLDNRCTLQWFELSAVGAQLFGKRWRTRMARWLGVDPITVWRWSTGRSPIPGPAVTAIQERRGMLPARERNEPALPAT